MSIIEEEDVIVRGGEEEREGGGGGARKWCTAQNGFKIWTVGVLFVINLINYMDRYTIAGEWVTMTIH